MLSRVWFFATPWTIARQAPLFMGFSGQEHLSGLPFPPLDMRRRGGSQRCMLGCISHNHHIELFSTGASLRQGRKLMQSMTDCLLLSLGKEGERAEVPLVISPEFGNWEFQVIWTAYWKGDPKNIFGLFVCSDFFYCLRKALRTWMSCLGSGKYSVCHLERKRIKVWGKG